MKWLKVSEYITSPTKQALQESYAEFLHNLVEYATNLNTSGKSYDATEIRRLVGILEGAVTRTDYTDPKEDAHHLYDLSYAVHMLTELMARISGATDQSTTHFKAASDLGVELREMMVYVIGVPGRIQRRDDEDRKVEDVF